MTFKQWIADNWFAFLVAVILVIVIVLLAGISNEQLAKLVANCPPCPTREVMPVNESSGFVGAAAVAQPTPAWVQRTEAFNAALYGKVLQMGVQSVSTALLDASPAHRVGTTMGLGWAESNPFEVCTSTDSCATCVKYDQGAVCYQATRNNYSFLSPPGWHYGDVVTGKITIAPPPTLSAPPGTPTAGR